MRKFTADDIRKLHEKCLFILRAAKRTDVASCQLLRQPLVDYRLTAGFDDLRPPTHTHTHTMQFNSTLLNAWINTAQSRWQPAIKRAISNPFRKITNRSSVNT